MFSIFPGFNYNVTALKSQTGVLKAVLTHFWCNPAERGKPIVKKNQGS
jgi:hypothetical protein